MRFHRKDLPRGSIIRPTLTKNEGAVAAANFLTNMGLFFGQSPAFFRTLNALAIAGGRARRQGVADDGNDE
jgi:hypothetical protein